MQKVSFAALALLGLVTVQSKPQEELVEQLPDIDPFEFGVYSGYVPIKDTQKQIHYLLVESQQDPSNDPLIIWFNGGPGCSSMLAFMQENGPYQQDDDTGDLKVNEYSWNREASVLYIEQPAGVGYSYCDHENHQDECIFDDNNVSEDNLKVVLAWFDKYPEYKTNDLYISGESYAGIYVPYLVNQIHHYNMAHIGSSEFTPNLKGMMVGNGCTNWKYDTTPAQIELYYWHSFISKELYEKYLANECDFTRFAEDPVGECLDVANEFFAATQAVNIYNILGYCYQNPAPSLEDKLGMKVIGGEQEQKGFTARDYTPWAGFNKFKTLEQEEPLSEVPPCVHGAPVIDYLNRDDVKQALHIPDNIQKWDMCESDIDYTSLEIGSQWIWEALKGEYRMLKFSGDTDGAVPLLGTRNWINSMNREILEEWRPYYVNVGDKQQKLAGYIEEYYGLTLGTVHGAGHMCPQFKPAETYHLIFNWLKQEKI